MTVVVSFTIGLIESISVAIESQPDWLDTVSTKIPAVVIEMPFQLYGSCEVHTATVVVSARM